jgi:Protein of unknown function (DUF3298)
MQSVTDYLTRRRDDFSEWVRKYAGTGDVHNALNIRGESYGSSSTRSLVLATETEGGIHPVTTFETFNYDVGKRAPITLDTLFEPGAALTQVLNPIVQRKLDERGGGELSTDGVGIDAYRNFAITDDSLIFFIDQDGPFPHDVGSFEVPVPRAELLPLMSRH